MLLQAHTFVQILVLPYGQLGVKGIAISFPVETGELVQQLPRPPSASGVVIVRAVPRQQQQQQRQEAQHQQQEEQQQQQQQQEEQAEESEGEGADGEEAEWGAEGEEGLEEEAEEGDMEWGEQEDRLDPWERGWEEAVGEIGEGGVVGGGEGAEPAAPAEAEAIPQEFVVRYSRTVEAIGWLRAHNVSGCVCCSWSCGTPI